MLMLILFVIHVLACFVMNTLCSKDITDSSKTGIDDEMNCQLFSNSSRFKKYLVSFQIGTHLLSNTGFTDFEAWSTVPMFLTILLGFVVFSILSAIVAASILENGRNTFKFRSQAEKLMKFLEKRNVRKSFRRRAYEHLNLIWERTKGINEHCLQELNLGPKLTEDIFLNRYQYVFRDACLFSDVPSTTFKIFVREMKIYHFRKGEIIQRVRDVVSDLFFLASGQIEVKDEYNDYIRTLEAASVFGNLQRGKYAESKVTLTARRNVETCGLPTERFLSLAKMQPSLLLRIGGYFDRKKDYLLPLAGETDLLKGLKKQSSQYYDMESDEEPVSRKKSLPSITNRSALQFMLINRWFKFGLKPDHKIFEMIDIMTVMSTVINLLIIPYVFVTQDSSPYYFVYLSLEPVYYLRLVMKFHKGFISYYGNFIFTNAKIAKKYLNSPREVFWDVVPNLPLELVCFTFHQEDWFFFYTCFRLIHMLRFYYIPNYFNTKEEILTMEKWLPLMKIMVYSILCCHFMACVFLFAACPFGSCLSESWMQSISGTSTEITPQNKMLLTYLYVITLMTTTDIGSIVRKRWFEIFFCSMSVLLGKVMVAVWIGELLGVLLTYGIPFMDYGNKTRLLLKHSKNNEISGFILHKTEVYLEKLWRYEKGENVPYLLEILPYSLKCDIMFSLYHEPLRQLFIFKDTSIELLRQICSRLHRAVYFENDYVLKQKDFYSKMYFIYEGEITVFNKFSDLSEAHHVVLRKNDSFGVLQGLNLETVQHFSYRVISKRAEILTLAYSDWIHLLEFFPDDKENVVSRGKREFARF